MKSKEDVDKLYAELIDAFVHLENQNKEYISQLNNLTEDYKDLAEKYKKLYRSANDYIECLEDQVEYFNRIFS